MKVVLSCLPASVSRRTCTCWAVGRRDDVWPRGDRTVGSVYAVQGTLFGYLLTTFDESWEVFLSSCFGFGFRVETSTPGPDDAGPSVGGRLGLAFLFHEDRPVVSCAVPVPRWYPVGGYYCYVFREEQINRAVAQIRGKCGLGRSEYPPAH